MKNRTKCVIRDGKFVEPCEPLSDVTEAGNPIGKRKGVYVWVMHSRESHDPTRVMFGVKSGDHVKTGMLFNFCPFCGERIDAPFNQEASDGN